MIPQHHPPLHSRSRIREILPVAMKDFIPELITLIHREKKKLSKTDSLEFMDRMHSIKGISIICKHKCYVCQSNMP